MKIRTAHSGYSLIETLIYVALIGAMIILTSSSLVSVYRTLTLLQTERKVLATGSTALEVMLQDIRAASSVNVAGSVFGTSPGMLKLGTITYTLANGVLSRQVGQSPTSSLTAQGVQANSLFFYRASSTISQIISVRLTLSAGSGISSTTKQFYGSGVLRGTY